jgi:hypothetical protein
MMRLTKHGGLMNEVSAFERYMRNQLKKQKDREDQKIIDEILFDMKKKHEQQHQEKITRAKAALELLTQGA